MSNLFDPKDLIAFILTPFIAALLVAEDRTIALSDAHDIRDQNIKAQKGFTNTFFAQAPPRYRKIAQNVGPILVAKEVTVTQC
ncbi:hypothetical protein DFH06DRAFT_1327988 [Mycena polygramma]|nr:hypothetical protein DFH06DRAFT_1327988 [Mycena polygramma]